MIEGFVGQLDSLNTLHLSPDKVFEHVHPYGLYLPNCHIS